MECWVPRLSYALKRREHGMKFKMLPCRPEWPDMSREEKEKIEGILGPELVSAYHIGSAAVPGRSAKPVLLRTHSGAAEGYGALVRQLPENFYAYCDSKDARIKQLEQEVLTWAERAQAASVSDYGGGI